MNGYGESPSPTGQWPWPLVSWGWQKTGGSVLDDPRVLLVGAACLLVVMAALASRRITGLGPARMAGRAAARVARMLAGPGPRDAPPGGLMARLWDQSDQAIIITDLEGTVLWANPAQCRSSGYALSDLVGRDVGIFKSGFTAAEVYHELWRTLHAGQCWRGVLHNRRRDGTLHWDKISIHPLRDGRGVITAYVAFKDDVTRQKTEEIDLLRRKERAESANLRKSQLLDRLSRDIRTPLNSILGFSELIKSGAFGPLEHPRYPGYIEGISESAQGLLVRIDEVLDLARIEAGEFQVRNEVIDVPVTVRAVLATMRTRAEAGGIHLGAELGAGLPFLRADERALRHILIQLVGNALRFTRRDGLVTVRAGAGADGGLDLAVVDTGVGMEQAEIAGVLKGDEAARRGRAGGLGLPLCRSLVALHGGTIGITSSLGVGTTVHVRFPRARVMTGEAVAQTSASRGAAPGGPDSGEEGGAAADPLPVSLP